MKPNEQMAWIKALNEVENAAAQLYKERIETAPESVKFLESHNAPSLVKKAARA